MVSNLRVALIGCGAVAALHAASVAADPNAELATVYSPRAERAAEFARTHGAARACTQIGEALKDVDAAIVCSPSEWHFEQAQACLRAGVQTLVELPACATAAEAEKLGELAQRQDVVLGCAHTSRFLEPYARIYAALRNGWLGRVEEIHYLRNVLLRARSWTDDALAHHAAHALDLALLWCGEITPAACAAFHNGTTAQFVSLLAVLPSGKSMTAAVSYAGHLPLSQMLVNGTRHTIVTDGFSRLRSDCEEMQFAGDETAVYEEAISRQDALFLSACRCEDAYIPWAETVNLVQIVNRFQELSRS
jgi:predicted dehydrogenase